MLKASTTSTRFAALGRLLKTHGKEGEVLVRPCIGTFFLDTHTTAALWLVPPTDDAQSLHLQGIRHFHQSDILCVTFAEIQNLTQAQELHNKDLLVELCDLSSAEYDALQKAQNEATNNNADHPWLGLCVSSAEYGDIGTIAEIIETGANDVLVVRGKRYGEVLLPVVDDCILSVNEEACAMQVKVLKGLI